MSKHRGHGEGSIEERNGRFRATRRCGVDATGKRQRESKTFDTRREAQQWLRETAGELRGEWARKPLADWLNHWLDLKRPNVEPATFVFYERRIRLHLLPRVGSIQLGAFRPIHVRQLLAKMTADGVSSGEQHKSLKTLRAALEEAVRLEQIGRNVAKSVKLPKVNRREMLCLDAGQAQTFLKAAGSDRLSALFWLALDAGMRPGELFALHWPDVDFAAGTVFVRQSLEEIAGKCRLKRPKTTKGKRQIAIAACTAEALAAHRERMKAEGHDVDRGLVFCGPEGGFLRISDVRRLTFLPLVKRADLPAIRMYDLRHTCATLLLANGVNVKVVSERLGHEDVTITLKHYAHVMPSMQEAAATVVQGLYGDCPLNDPKTENPDATFVPQTLDQIDVWPRGGTVYTRDLKTHQHCFIRSHPLSHTSIFWVFRESDSHPFSPILASYQPNDPSLTPQIHVGAYVPLCALARLVALWPAIPVRTKHRILKAASAAQPSEDHE